MAAMLPAFVGRHGEAAQTTNQQSIINMNELIEKTRQWFHDKGIIANSNPLKQLNKSQEELTETRDAAVKLNFLGEIVELQSGDGVDECLDLLDEIKDGIGDTVVTLIGVCEFYGVTLEECLQMAYDTISKRSGKMENGIFIKDN